MNDRLRRGGSTETAALVQRVWDVLTSVIAAYYYIRIIKVMYFEEAKEGGFDAAEDRSLNLVLLASSAVIVFFIVLPAPILTSAQAAAQSLIK